MILSVISPIYQAELTIEELIRRLTLELQKLTVDYEIILVDDGSKDEGWNVILKYSKNDYRIKGIKLSRNFGQHYAVTAGITRAVGDRLIILDCDLQDDPVYISKLMKEMDNGYDIVFTERLKRKHGLFKSIASSFYNGLFKLLSNNNYSINMGSLVIFSKKVSTSFLQLKEKDRLYIQVLKWLGYSNTSIKVIHNERFSGKSSYAFLKLISLGLQGWTSHSLRLLQISIYLGFFLAFGSFCLSLFILYKFLFFELQPGWPSIIIAILFSTGLILLSIGITGIYIGKTFEQTKGRPLFIEDYTVNFNE